MFDLTETQRQMQDTARKFTDKEIRPSAAEVDRSEVYPWENVEKLRAAGFMGMTVPEKYGGPGLSYLDAVVVIEEVAKACGVSARIVVEANMGAIGAIMAYGSEDQKRLAAGCVLAGDKPAICITEPGAGLSIILSRPFALGDTVCVKNVSGIVETRIAIDFSEDTEKAIETLRQVIKDCGGVVAVPRRLSLCHRFLLTWKYKN